MDYKPYSPEWHRKRYLKEALDKYFDDYVENEVIYGDMMDILSARMSAAVDEVNKVMDLKDKFKSFLMNFILSILFAVTLWVQVPQWDDDWSNCAVDVPDSSCHWYIVNADNTFGEGFDWETAPWYSIEGLQDIANLHDDVVESGHQYTMEALQDGK